jgi:hypothetical protein
MLKLSSDCGDNGSKKFKRGYRGGNFFWQKSGDWSQAVCFVLVPLAGN